MAVHRAAAGTSTREAPSAARAYCLLPLRRSRRGGNVRTHSNIPGNGEDAKNGDYDFTYDGNDGRKKATFEQAFKEGVTEELQDRLHAAPWEFSCVPRVLD